MARSFGRGSDFLLHIKGGASRFCENGLKAVVVLSITVPDSDFDEDALLVIVVVGARQLNKILAKRLAYVDNGSYV